MKKIVSKKYGTGKGLASSKKSGRHVAGMKVLRIRTLDKGWWDRDHVLLHAAFQLLTDFIEQEKPDQIVDWGSDPKHKQAWKEIRFLYRWWTRTRPARRSPLDVKGLKKPPTRRKMVPASGYCRLLPYDRKKYAAYDAALKRLWRLETKWEAEDQKCLHRLIDIRQFLWT